MVQRGECIVERRREPAEFGPQRSSLFDSSGPAAANPGLAESEQRFELASASVGERS